MQLTQDVSFYLLGSHPCLTDRIVVPSRMNPVEEGGNQFGSLFDKMPAKRIGRTEDIAGVVLYLCSQAGVRFEVPIEDSKN